jgi:hypothetical protein
MFSLNVQSAPRSTPVTVTNDSSNPVPITVENHQTSISINNTETNPLPVVIPDSVSVKGNHYRYIGQSSSTVKPVTGGLHGLNNACTNDYGMAARMCTSEEFFQSASIPDIPDGYSWIQPHIVAVIPNYTSTKTGFIDYTGKILSGYTNSSYDSITCDGWVGGASSDAATALLSDHANGGNRHRVLVVGCHNQLPVVCCTPQ